MDSILITPKTEQEYSFVMEMLKRMKIKASPVHAKSIVRMTAEEFNVEIDRSLEAALEGNVISHEDLEREMMRW